MKKFSLLLTFILLLASCSEDNLVTPNPDSDQGVHATLGFTVKSMQGDVNTKSTDPVTVNEKLITRLWTLQFVEGTLVKKYYTTINAATTVDDVVKADILLTPNVTGKKSNIYFVANVNKNTLANFYGDETAFQTAVEPIVSETAILLSGNDLDQTKICIPMFGKKEQVTVTAQGLDGGISISLERMLARIDLRYAVGEIAATKFTLKGIRVCNVPNVMSYVPPATATFPVTLDPSSVQSFAIEKTTVGSDVAASGGNPAMKQLTFYLPENIRGNGTNSSGLDKLKGGVPFATYFEFSGVGAVGSTYAGEQIKYKLYPGSDTKVNYDIKRNNRYILTANLANLSFSDRRVTRAGANCYIVSPKTDQAPDGGTVFIPLSRVNESLLDVQIADIYAPNCTAFIYWSTVGATSGGNVIRIEDPTCQDAQIKVTGLEKGNAVVAIKDNVTEKILWSWHIWVTDVKFDDPIVNNPNTNTITYGTTTYTFMDRNLGATELPGVLDNRFDTTAGMLYQWGRKDPFLPAKVKTPTTVDPFSGTLPIVSSTEIKTSYTKVGAIPPANGATLVNSGDNYLTKVALATTGEFTYGNQLTYSIQSPSLFLLNWGGSTSIAPVDATNGATMGADSWGGEYPTFKSVYDPCPKGWRVPSGKVKDATWASPWAVFGPPALAPSATSPINTIPANITAAAPKFITTTPTASATTPTLVDNACYVDWGIYGKYPASGSRNASSGAFTNVGASGFYWSGSVPGTSGYYLSFTSTTVKPSFTNSRASGCGVRCVRE